MGVGLHIKLQSTETLFIPRRNVIKLKWNLVIFRNSYLIVRKQIAWNMQPLQLELITFLVLLRKLNSSQSISGTGTLLYSIRCRNGDLWRLRNREDTRKYLLGFRRKLNQLHRHPIHKHRESLLRNLTCNSIGYSQSKAHLHRSVRVQSKWYHYKIHSSHLLNFSELCEPMHTGGVLDELR